MIYPEDAAYLIEQVKSLLDERLAGFEKEKNCQFPTSQEEMNGYDSACQDIMGLLEGYRR